VIHVPSLIERKRDGGDWNAEEVAEFIRGFVAGDIPDYQVSAWAMAVYFRGLSPEETLHLLRAMLASGNTFRHPAGSPPKVDKHSTGGIGDKISLILAPLLACDDLWVPMISGRGLGITGGTLDKLESIPGFNVRLDEAMAAAQLQRLGVFMIGQSAEICPADRKLYALRDVTGTVPSIPLIIASIMSKKLAEGLDRLVLDVKFGAGAFMQDRESAATLAEGLRTAGEMFGVSTRHLLMPMDEPLGHAAGNALEVAEAVATLQGDGPEEVTALTLDLAECVSNAPRAQLASWLNDGTAWRKFVALVEAQGGDATTLERVTEVHAAPIRVSFRAPHAGTLRRMDAGLIGRGCVALGAGRASASDAIDYAVGCSEFVKVGARVSDGEPLFCIHARNEASLGRARHFFDQAITISDIE
jgi:pyrimidine-nucleoside phosphorylase